MAVMEETVVDIATKLASSECVIVSGQEDYGMSVVHVDLNRVAMYPALLKQLACHLAKTVLLSSSNDEYVVCAGSSTAVPLATLVAVDLNLPYLLIDFHRADGAIGCLNNSSKFSISNKKAFVVFDDARGEHTDLLMRKIKDVTSLSSVEALGVLPSIFKDNGIALVDAAIASGYATAEQGQLVQRVQHMLPILPRLSYAKRALKCQNACARSILNLMDEKRTNLAVAADVATATDLLKLADDIGPYICVLKTHADAVDGFTAETAAALSELAIKHNFMIFEDRKFADIGSLVQRQYQGGALAIADWAHIIDAHPVTGPGIIAGLAEVGVPKGRGLLVLAEMSTAGTLAAGAYSRAAVDMALERPDFVIGFVSQCRQLLTRDPRLLYFTPGVQLQVGTDALGQQYRTPSKVIADGTDVIIVGRGIYRADDPVKAAIKYRDAGWSAYEQAI